MNEMTIILLLWTGLLSLFVRWVFKKAQQEAKKRLEEQKRREEEKEARASRSASRREEPHREAAPVAPRPTQPKPTPTPSVPLYEGHFPQEKSFIQQG